MWTLVPLYRQLYEPDEIEQPDVDVMDEILVLIELFLNDESIELLIELEIVQRFEE